MVSQPWYTTLIRSALGVQVALWTAVSETSPLAIFDSAQSSPLVSVYVQERIEERNEDSDEDELQRCRPDGFLVWFQVETAGQSVSASAKHNT